jgi:hypothetical protein
VHLLELAAQSVRGFSPAARVALKPGYLILKSPAETPSPLAGLLLALCFPDGRGGDATFLAVGAKTGKAGFSFQGNDQSAWRLVRELGGAGSLHRLNRATNQFEVVTQDSAEIGQVLRASVGMPPRTTFEQLFTFTPAQLPTRRPKGKAPAADKPRPKLASGMGAAMADLPAPGVNPDEARAKIVELEKELGLSKQIGEIQFRQDGLQAELFKLEAMVKAWDDAKASVQRAMHAVVNVPTFASLGLAPDILEKVKRFPVEQQKRDEALQKVLEEQTAAEETRATVSVPSLQQDPRFMGSVAAGLVLVGIGAFLDNGGQYLALLGVPAFTFGALVALKHIEDLQVVARQSTRVDLFSSREKKINDDFAAYSGQVKGALKAANVETAEEFTARLSGRAELEAAAAEAQGRLAQMEADPQTAQALSQAAKLKAEQEQITARLLEMSGGYIRDEREVMRDLAKTRESLGRPAVPVAAAPAVEEFQAVTTDPTETFEDPVPALLTLGADLFNSDVPTLWSVLKDRSGQYIAALTDRRLHGVEVDKDGRAKVLAPGRTIPAGELPGKDLDLVYLSIRLTLVEKYSAQSKVPVIFEDAFRSVLDDAKLPLVIRMLKHLGTMTQILHVTPLSHAASPTDPVLAL